VLQRFFQDQITSTRNVLAADEAPFRERRSRFVGIAAALNVQSILPLHKKYRIPTYLSGLGHAPPISFIGHATGRATRGRL